MKIKTITTYYYSHETPLDLVIRKKHNSYSYWNYAAKKWYGDNDARLWGTKTETTEDEALKIIQDNTTKYETSKEKKT